MTKFKKVLRVTALVLFMILASVGVGISGAAPTLARNREKYFTQMEQVDTKEEEAEEGDEEKT